MYYLHIIIYVLFSSLVLSSGEMKPLVMHVFYTLESKILPPVSLCRCKCRNVSSLICTFLCSQFGEVPAVL